MCYINYVGVMALISIMSVVTGSSARADFMKENQFIQIHLRPECARLMLWYISCVDQPTTHYSDITKNTRRTEELKVIASNALKLMVSRYVGPKDETVYLSVLSNRTLTRNVVNGTLQPDRTKKLPRLRSSLTSRVPVGALKLYVHKIGQVTHGRVQILLSWLRGPRTGEHLKCIMEKATNGWKTIELSVVSQS